LEFSPCAHSLIWLSCHFPIPS